MEQLSKEELIHITYRGQIVPLENIDYIGDLETGNMWDDSYKIYLKSTNIVNVSSGRNYSELSSCRKSLITKFTAYTIQSQNNIKP